MSDTGIRRITAAAREITGRNAAIPKKSRVRLSHFNRLAQRRIPGAAGQTTVFSSARKSQSRTIKECNGAKVRRFQSVRRARWTRPPDQWDESECRCISIHSPRAGRDLHSLPIRCVPGFLGPLATRGPRLAQRRQEA